LLIRGQTQADQRNIGIFTAWCFAWAGFFGAGQLFCMGYYFLEQFGAPRISMVFTIVPLSFGWAIGSALVASRYR
jgi:hypothetical protein